MTNLLPPELFTEQPIQSDFARQSQSYAIRRMITVGVLLFMVGGGLFFAFRQSSSDNPSEIPLIKADGGSFKQRPEQPGGIDIPNQDVRVYQELDNKNGSKEQVEHLLPPPETPQIAATTPNVVQPPTTASERAVESLLPEKRQPVSIPTTVLPPAPATVVPIPVQPPMVESPPAAPIQNAQLAAQPVLAPAISPVTSPVPVTKTAEAVPAKDIQSKDSQPKDIVLPGGGGVKVVGVKAVPAPQKIMPSKKVVTTIASAPRIIAKSAPTKSAPRHLTIEEIIRESETEKPSGIALGVPKKASVAPGGKGSVFQLASLPSQTEAQRTLQRIQSKYAGSLHGVSLRLVRADLPKGTYYRVQGTASSEAAARTICADLKRHSAGCILVTPR